MKKGFTLVELLGVFAIMSMIVLIAVPSVTNLLKQADQDRYNNFKNDLFLAAEAYISSNNDLYPELRDEKKTYVTVKTLLYSDYIDSTAQNPKTKKHLYNEEEYNKVIIVIPKNNVWEYEFIGDNEGDLSDDEKEAIITYDQLSTESEETEVSAVNTEINNLPDGQIKEALQNRMEYRIGE